MTKWPRAILHVDMDAFYAAVEQRDHPEYRGKPLLVGGKPEERGVIATASYEARKYGIHSAMPTGKALRLCPQAILVRPRHTRYAEVSSQIFDIFSRITPLIQPVSLDEAFLDVTDSQTLFGEPMHIAQYIQKEILKQTELTASVGVSSCRFAAKIASDLEKPNGLTVIPSDQIAERLSPLPVKRIWGVGPVAEKQLTSMGIRTIGHLRQWQPSALATRLGALGPELWRLAYGIDDSPVHPEHEIKSISHENTFPKDITVSEELTAELLDQAEKVARRLRGQGMTGRVIFIKVRYDDFSTITRQKTLSGHTDLAETIYTTARKLLFNSTHAGRRPIRLLGIGVTDLSSRREAGAGQMKLFDLSAEVGSRYSERAPETEKQSALERMMDSIRTRWGPESIERATLRFKSE